jgi:hypothetical protein
MRIKVIHKILNRWNATHLDSEDANATVDDQI